MITANATIFIYDSTTSSPSCFDEESFTVNIDPQPLAGTLNNEAICPGDFATIRITGYLGDSIRWQSSPKGLNIWGADSALVSVDSLIVSPIQEMDYRAIVSYAGGVCTEDTTTTGTVSLQSIVAKGVWTEDSVYYCTGSSAVIDLTGGQGSAVWQESTDGLLFNNYSQAKTNDSTGTVNYINAGTVLDTMWVRVRYTTTCDTIYSDTLMVVIHPQPESGTLAGGDSICLNSDITLTITGEKGDSIRWERNNASLGAWTVIAGENSTSITQTPLEETQYRAIVKYSNGLCFEDTTNTDTVFIKRLPIAGNLGPDETTICTGSTLDLELNGSFGFNYTWFSSVDNSSFNTYGSGIMNDTIATGVSLINGGIEADTNWYFVAVGTVCDTVYSDTVMVISDPKPNANLVSGGAICPGDSVKIGLTFVGDSIRWESSPMGSNTWTPIITTNSDSIYVSPLVNSDYRAIVRFDASSCFEDTASIGTVTINPDAIGGVTAGIDTLCTGDTTVITLAGSVGLVQWQDSIAGGTWVNIGLASVDTFVVVSPDTSNPEHFYRAIVGNGSCIDTSDIHALYVKLCCVAPTLADISPDSVIICGISNDTLVSVSTDAPAGYIYTWYSVSDDVTPIAGPTADLDTLRITATDTVYVVIQMPNVPGCELKSDSSIVDIRPDVVAGTVMVDPTPICNGETTGITLAGYTGTFVWQLNDGTGWRDTTIVSDSWTHQPMLPIDSVRYRAIVTNSTVCIDTTNESLLEIIAQPIAGVVDVLSPICENDSINVFVSNSIGGIRWQDSLAASGVWNDLAGTDTSMTYPTTGTTTRYFRVIAGTGLCADTSTIDSLLINPKAVGGVASVTSPICHGDSANLTLTGYVGDIQWQDSSAVTAGTWMDIAHTTDDVWVTYPDSLSPVTLRAILTNNPGGCTDTSNVTILQIDSLAIGGEVSINDSICSGDGAIVSLTGHRGVIQWQTSSASNPVWRDTLNGLAVENILPTESSDTLFYRAILEYQNNGCIDTSSIDTLIVHPIAVGGVALVESPICDGDSALLTLTGYTGAIQWQDSSSAGNWTNIVSATTDNMYVTYPLAQTDVSFRAVLTNPLGQCMDTSNTTTLRIIDQPIGGVVSVVDSICENDSVTVMNIGSYGAIRWQDSLAASGVWNDLVGTDTIETYATIGTTVRYFRAIAGFGQCADTSSIDSVVINPKAVGGIATVTTPVCHGDSALLQLSSYVGTSIFWEDSSALGTWNPIGKTTDSLWVTYPDSTSPVSFRVVVTNDPGGCLDTSSVTVLQVDSLAIGGFVSINDSICSGDGAQLTLTGYRGLITWQDSSAVSGGWNTRAETSDNEMILPPSVHDTLFFRAILEYNANGCVDTSTIDTLIVHPAAESGIGSVDDADICEGETTTVRLIGYDGVRIQWQDSTATGWVDISNATADTLQVATTLANSPQRVRAVVTHLGECSDTSNVVEIRVASQAVAGTLMSIPDSICEGYSGLLISTGHQGVIQWQEETTPNVFVDIDIATNATANSDTLVVTPTIGIYNYRVVYGVGECTDTSDVEDIKVVEDALAGVASVDPTIICEGETAEVTLIGYRGNIVWQDSSAIKGWSNVINSNINNDTMTVSPSDEESPVFYRAIVTNSNICTYTSAPTQLEIIPHVVGGFADAVNDTICNGSSDIIELTGSFGTISWQVSADGIVWSDTTAGDVTSITVSPSTGVGVVSNNYYRAILDNGVCTDTSTIADVTTYPDVVLNVLIDGPNRLCQNDLAVFTVVDSLGGGQNPTFQWYVNDVAANPVKITANGTTYSDTTLTNGAVIKVEMSSDSLCAINPVMDSIQIQIDPLLIPMIKIRVIDSVQCEGELFEFFIVDTLNLGLTPTFQWFKNDKALTGRTDTIFSSNALLNNDVIKLQVTQSPEVCTANPLGYSNPIQLDVHDKPEVGNLTQSRNICYGDEATLKLASFKGVIEWQYSLDGVDWNQLEFDGTVSKKVNPSSLYNVDSILTSRTTQYRAVVYEVEYNSHECDSVISRAVNIREIPLPYGEIVVIDTSCENHIALIEPRTYNNGFTEFTGWYQSFDGVNYHSYNSQFVLPNNNISLTDTNVKAQYFIAEFKTIASGIECVTEDTIALRDCPPPDVDIPNAMTPNGDGTNNTFWINNIWFYPENSLRIYNRWGSLVFKADGYNNDWDGTRHGADMPAAVYYYILELNDEKKTDPFKGTVTIFR